ncbi:MAG: hypothetical protein JNG84_12340 [Archangium sp.]|nr:hypothetical protein [Archangium sp.]
MPLLPTLLLVLAGSAPDGGVEPAWEESTTADDVTVFRRATPGSPIKSVKGTGVVDAPPQRVALVLVDDDRAPEWVDSLAEAKVLEQLSPTEYLEYNHASMPLIVSDRDFVTRVTMSVDSSTGVVTMVSRPAETPLAPERAGVVRGVLSARYIIEPVGASSSRLTVEIHTDPRGSLPAWVVNFFQKDWARETIAGIRKQAAKKDLTPPPPFAAFLGQIGTSTRDAGAP